MPTQTIHPDLTAAIMQAWAEMDYADIWPLVLRPDSDKPLVIHNADELHKQTIGAEPVTITLEA